MAYVAFSEIGYTRMIVQNRDVISKKDKFKKSYSISIAKMSTIDYVSRM